MTPKESRETAMRAARFCKDSLGMSQKIFEEAIDLGEFVQPEIQEALAQLKDRGELSHLIIWVWSFTKE
jgi:hypothetical protein